jgi:hypothetical protein
LETSCANIDRRDGGSVGSGGGTCAWTSGKPDSKKNREKLEVLVTLCFIIIAPRPDSTAQTLMRNWGDALAHTGPNFGVFEDEPGRRSAAKLLTREEAQRVALVVTENRR